MSLVVQSLEQEGVTMMRECEPQMVRRGGGEGEEGRLQVSWYDKSTGDTKEVRNILATKCIIHEFCAHLFSIMYVAYFIG